MLWWSLGIWIRKSRNFFERLRDNDESGPSLRNLTFFGPRLVYTTFNHRKMNNFIEHCDEDQFANGQSRRDLRVSSFADSNQSTEAI